MEYETFEIGELGEGEELGFIRALNCETLSFVEGGIKILCVGDDAIFDVETLKRCLEFGLSEVEPKVFRASKVKDRRG